MILMGAYMLHWGSSPTELSSEFIMWSTNRLDATALNKSPGMPNKLPKIAENSQKISEKHRAQTRVILCVGRAPRAHTTHTVDILCRKSKNAHRMNTFCALSQSLCSLLQMPKTRTEHGHSVRFRGSFVFLFQLLIKGKNAHRTRSACARFWPICISVSISYRGQKRAQNVVILCAFSACLYFCCSFL